MSDTILCPDCKFFSKCYQPAKLVKMLMHVVKEEGTNLDELSEIEFSEYFTTMLDELDKYLGGKVQKNVYAYVKSIMVKGADMLEFKLPAYVLDTDMKTARGWRDMIN